MMSMGRLAAGAAGRVAAVATRWLAAPPRLAAPVRSCSNGQSPPTPPSNADMARALFEEFISSFKGKQPNLVNAASLSETITTVLKTYPAEVALPMVRGLIQELSVACQGSTSTMESRLVKLEVAQKIDRQFAFGTYTIFGGILLLIPGSIHIVSLNSDKKIDDTLTVVQELKSRVAEVEKAGPKAQEQEMIEVIKAKFAELERAIGKEGSGVTDNDTKALVEILKTKLSELERLAQKSQVEPAPTDKN